MKKTNKILTTLFLVLTFFTLTNSVKAESQNDGSGGPDFSRSATCYYKIVEPLIEGNYIKIRYLNGSILDKSVEYKGPSPAYSIAIESAFLSPVNFENSNGEAGCPKLYYQYIDPLFTDHKYNISSSSDNDRFSKSLSPDMEKSTITNVGEIRYKQYTVNYTNNVFTGNNNTGTITIRVGTDKKVAISAYTFLFANLSTSSLSLNGITYDDIHDASGNIQLTNVYYCKNNASESDFGAKLSLTAIDGNNPACVKLSNSPFAVSSDGVAQKSGDGLVVNFTTGDLSCTSFGTLMDFIYDFYRTILIYMGALLVVLGMLDFGKAAMSESADAMKKATKAFTTRIIILVILFILPGLLNIVFEMFKITTCIPGI